MGSHRFVISRGPCALALLWAGAPALAQTYRYVEVPLLPGAIFGEGLGVNDLGRAVGRCNFAAGTSQSWSFDPATGTLTPLPFGSHRGNEGAVAINNAGQVAGTITNGTLSSACLYSGGVLSSLTRDTTTLAESSVGTAVNQAGEVAGRHSFQCAAAAPQRGATWSSATASPVEAITAYACGVGEARGNNDLGWACGASQTQFTSPAEVWSRPAVWNGTAMGLLPSINASGRESAFANDINNSNEVCGRSEDRSGVTVSQPVYWSSAGTIAVLGGGAGAECRSINDRRDIVGYQPLSGSTTALIWRGNGGGVTNAPVDLNSVLFNPLTAPARLARADGVSNTGYIVGRVDGSGGSSHAFVLEPCTPAVLSAPSSGEVECGAAVTLGASAVGAGPIAYEWTHNFVPVGTGPTLDLASFGPDSAGEYTCAITSACGITVRVTAVLSLPCPADFDRSGGTPDVTDIDMYFIAWLAGDPASDADCSGGTPDSTDIDVFFAAWLAGGC